MEYRGILRKRSPWMKAAVIFLAVVTIYIEIHRRQFIYVLLALFAVLAAFFQKEHKISEEGIDIEYTLFSMVSHNYWRWNEITTLHTDYRKAKPYVMLHIGKDILIRSFVMDYESCRGTLRLARKMNPKIYIVDDKNK